MTSLAALHVPLQWQLSLLLLPAAGLGHRFGLIAHERLISGDQVLFRRYLGIGMALVSVLGLINVIL